jgi:signal transduction histidine kinase/sugar lactone lactonase YvrE
MSDDTIIRWQNGRMTQFGPADGLNRLGAKLSFAADREGQVWIASGDFLGRFQKGKLFGYERRRGFPQFVAPSHSGGVWIWSGDRLLKTAGTQISVINTNLPWTPMGGVVRAMYEETNGGLWIGTSAQGLFRYSDGQFARVSTSHNAITSVTEDREGNVWVGTVGGGLNRLRRKAFSICDTRTGLLEDVSDAVCVDDRGEAWLANRGGGIARMADGRASVVQLQEGKHKLNVNAICVDDSGNVWAGTGGGIYRFQRDAPERVDHMEESISGVHVLFKSRDGDVWVGAEPDVLGRFHGDKFERFGEEQGFTSRSVRAIAEDPSGKIWIGTESGRLFELADGRFTSFGAADGLPSAPIRALLADDDGSVWIGTAGGGLLLRHDQQFTQFPVSAGLPDDIVVEILEDDSGRLWCGSRRGIFHVAKKDLLDFAQGRLARVNGVTLGKNEGLSGVYCQGASEPMAWKGNGGVLWFATQQGVLELDSSALKSNLRPPPVFIDELLVNDQPVAMQGAIKLPPLLKKLEVRFAALEYAAPEKVRLRHKLEGVDSGWIETSGTRNAVYAGLPPGHYLLRVNSCNDEGIWEEATGVSLGFTVLPAWWQSWWWQAAALVVFTLGIVLIVHHSSQRRLKLKLERLVQQRALEKERARIARDLHDDLGASLTQIGLQAEMARGEWATAEELREQSALLAGRVRTLAHELDAIVWTINPKNDSLDKLATYLCQFSQEFFRLTPIRCRLDVAEEIPAWPLTPEMRHDLFLATKEAMNNIVKHSEASEVWLRIRVKHGVFELVLEDNGRGFSPGAIKDSQRNGLGNMRSRVRSFGGEFEIRSRPGTGTVVAIGIQLPESLLGNGNGNSNGNGNGNSNGNGNGNGNGNHDSLEGLNGNSSQGK